MLISYTTTEMLQLGDYQYDGSDIDLGSEKLIPAQNTDHLCSGGATLWQSSANALPVYCHALPVALPVF